MTELAKFARSDHSQLGEDGILERIFQLLGVTEGWCVEFGAWDGVHLSNTYSLISRHNWHGVLIEADKRKFAELQGNMSAQSRVTCLNRFVEAHGPSSLDSILRAADVPRDFDLLSIDIDGNDYHVWEGLSAFEPKVVVVEYNPSIPNHVEYVQRYHPKVQQGNSVLSLTRLAGRKGYELCATTTINAFFVRRDLFPLLGVEDNSLDNLRRSRKHLTTLFQLQDGTLVIDGFTKLLWLGEPIRQERIQVVPRLIRRDPLSASRGMRYLQRKWVSLERLRRKVRERLAAH